MYRLRKSLVFFLIFTVISSLVAYHVAVKAYDRTIERYAREGLN